MNGGQPANVGFALDPAAVYPAAPFSPPRRYEEFYGSWLADEAQDADNRVYALVRQALFRQLGAYDESSGGIDLTALQWPGVRKILVKPNWVLQGGSISDCVLTHGSVLRPIIDYLLLAFGESCEIVVGDVPLQSADIETVWSESGAAALQQHYARLGLPVRFIDLRREKIAVDASGFISSRDPLPGDPAGYTSVALGAESLLEEVTSPQSRFSVNDYEPGTTACHHEAGRHGYFLSRTALESDLFVNVAKLKTHCKAGLTACMKNLIGINGDKGWIPHFRRGAPADGGDEYPDANRRMQALKQRIRESLQGRNRWLYSSMQLLWKTYKSGVESATGARLTAGGGWPGNDTLWRGVLDLVRAITFADGDGRLHPEPQRRQLCLIDAVTAGEGEGPLRPTPRQIGAIVCAETPAAADFAACRLMGFDWRKIPQLAETVRLPFGPGGRSLVPDALTARWRGETAESLATLPRFDFATPHQWRGILEAAADAEPIAAAPGDEAASQA